MRYSYRTTSKFVVTTVEVSMKKLWTLKSEVDKSYRVVPSWLDLSYCKIWICRMGRKLKQLVNLVVQKHVTSWIKKSNTNRKSTILHWDTSSGKLRHTEELTWKAYFDDLRPRGLTLVPVLSSGLMGSRIWVESASRDAEPSPLKGNNKFIPRVVDPGH